MGNQLTTQQIIKKVFVRIRAIIHEFSLFILHCVGLLPSHHVRRFFYRLADIQIGKGSTIHTGAKFYSLGNIIIGNDTIIGEDVVLDGRDKITIGDHVDIGSEVMFYNAEHDIHSDDFAPIFGTVTVENYVFIGPRAIILPGVHIGRGAVIGAGAVVTKNVDPHTIVGGVPAKPIGQRRAKDLHYRVGRAQWFR